MRMETRYVRSIETQEHMLTIQFPAGAPEHLWDQALTAYFDAEYYIPDNSLAKGPKPTIPGEEL